MIPDPPLARLDVRAVPHAAHALGITVETTTHPPAPPAAAGPHLIGVLKRTPTTTARRWTTHLPQGPVLAEAVTERDATLLLLASLTGLAGLPPGRPTANRYTLRLTVEARPADTRGWVRVDGHDTVHGTPLTLPWIRRRRDGRYLPHTTRAAPVCPDLVTAMVTVLAHHAGAPPIEGTPHAAADPHRGDPHRVGVPQRPLGL